ncbi:hypothetical protein AB0469_22355 [Streptomyces sp. NPDC093801]|uniref:hypothetical protein n=1 Tax=Streptomyces sp. NPDC093801 TaxID=3155203 RepID=UPI00344BECA7
MTRRTRAPAASLTGWWAGLALILWCTGQARDQPAPLLACAASAALLGALGELGAWTRKCRHARRVIRRRSGGSPPGALRRQRCREPRHNAAGDG